MTGHGACLPARTARSASGDAATVGGALPRAKARHPAATCADPGCVCSVVCSAVCATGACPHAPSH